MQSSRRSCSVRPKRHKTAACLCPTSLRLQFCQLTRCARPSGCQRKSFSAPLRFYPKIRQSPRTQFPTKTINPRPGKDATRLVSTDGQQNELNDRRNTEQDTKLVKNRNKITIEYAKLAEKLQCLATKPQDCHLPESHFFVIPQFCPKTR